MQTESGADNRLVFTQTWFDFWFIVILFTLLMMLVTWNAISGLIGWMIFAYALLQIFFPVYLFFKFLAIRKFEITPEVLRIFIGDRKVCIELTKQQLAGIHVRLGTFFRAGSPKIIFNFIYQPDVTLAIHLFARFLYGKKISVNHLLFEPDTEKMIAFLEAHYADILNIEDAVKEYLKEKKERLKKEIEQSD